MKIIKGPPKQIKPVVAIETHLGQNTLKAYMKNSILKSFYIGIFGMLSFLTYAQELPPDTNDTVQGVYPGLTAGALSYAKLKELPETVLLQSDNIQIQLETITKIIEAQPEQVREELRKNAFFILEQEAAKQLLRSLASKAASNANSDKSVDDNELINRFFETVVFKTVEVTDAEVKAFYEQNKDMCGGATLEQIQSSLKEYVLGEKKQQIASDYVRNLGKQVSIQVSENWVKQQAVMSFDNPVDKARRSGKPALVDFGAGGCKPCEMMAPILERLRKKYEGKMEVIFIHVREQQILASRYGIQSIPVQIFFDKSGKEVFRHTGFLAQEEIEKKIKELGVQ